MSGDAAESLGKSFGIAVDTTWADLGTAPNRVPGRVSPLDARMVAHTRRPTGHACLSRSQTSPSLTDPSNEEQAFTALDSPYETKAISCFSVDGVTEKTSSSTERFDPSLTDMEAAAPLTAVDSQVIAFADMTGRSVPEL
jgi:hypothetical protein